MVTQEFNDFITVNSAGFSNRPRLPDTPGLCLLQKLEDQQLLAALPIDPDALPGLTASVGRKEEQHGTVEALITAASATRQTPITTGQTPSLTPLRC